MILFCVFDDRNSATPEINGVGIWKQKITSTRSWLHNLKNGTDWWNCCQLAVVSFLSLLLTACHLCIQVPLSAHFVFVHCIWFTLFFDIIPVLVFVLQFDWGLLFSRNAVGRLGAIMNCLRMIKTWSFYARGTHISCSLHLIRTFSVAWCPCSGVCCPIWLMLVVFSKRPWQAGCNSRLGDLITIDLMLICRPDIAPSSRWYEFQLLHIEWYDGDLRWVIVRVWFWSWWSICVQHYP